MIFDFYKNGEIYNCEEIRDLLIKQGYQFETKTDTEVLLKAYHFWGFVDLMVNLNTR